VTIANHQVVHTSQTKSINSGASAEEVGLVGQLRPRVAAALQPAGADTTGSRWPVVVEQAVARVLDTHAHEALAAGRAPLEVGVEARLRRALVDSFTGAGGLQRLLDDDDVETINVNGCDNVWVHYRDGTRVRVAPVAVSDEELVALLRELGARQGVHERRFSIDHPELSMQLPGGARLHAMLHITDRVVVSIRRHRLMTVTLDDLVELGELTPGLAGLFAAMVAARRNIVVCGGPAVGKTTFLRALANAIPVAERLVTVEDSYELALDRGTHPNLVAMQAREANLEGVGEFTLDQCVRASLRLSPDRVIVGEVRGAEVVTMAKAMSIGMDGSLATVHASSSRQALLRLVTYAMEPPASYPREAAAALVGQAVHVVVHLDRTAEGTRVVSSVREVAGDEAGQVVSNEVYRPGRDNRAMPATRLTDETMDLLAAVGYHPPADETGGWGR
jgi:Flp pilus assembly CpaF family ATPase